MECFLLLIACCMVAALCGSVSWCGRMCVAVVFEERCSRSSWLLGCVWCLRGFCGGCGGGRFRTVSMSCFRVCISVSRWCWVSLGPSGWHVSLRMRFSALVCMMIRAVLCPVIFRWGGMDGGGRSVLLVGVMLSRVSSVCSVLVRLCCPRCLRGVGGGGLCRCVVVGFL